MRLKDKVVIVTGGGSGIGEEYCRGIVQEGGIPCIFDIQPTEVMDNVLEDILGAGGQGMAFNVDISDHENVLAKAKLIYERFGRIDGLVNNAVWQPAKPFNEYTVTEFDKMMAINIRGPWSCIVAVHPYMKQAQKGKIVNIASQTFFYGWWNLAPYVASKGAMIGMTRALARELGADGIRVNSLSPGLTVTEGSLREVQASIRPGKVNEWLDMHVEGQCIKHPGYPQDLVGTLIYLLSDDSDFMTGQSMIVDGGWVFN